MDLSEAGICKISSLLVALKRSRTVGIHCVGGKEIGVSISAGSNYDGMGAEALELTGNQVAGDYTLSLSVHHYEVEHLVPGICLYGTGCNFFVE